MILEAAGMSCNKEGRILQMKGDVLNMIKLIPGKTLILDDILELLNEIIIPAPVLPLEFTYTHYVKDFISI